MPISRGWAQNPILELYLAINDEESLNLAIALSEKYIEQGKETNNYKTWLTSNPNKPSRVKLKIMISL